MNKTFFFVSLVSLMALGPSNANPPYTTIGSCGLKAIYTENSKFVPGSDLGAKDLKLDTGEEQMLGDIAGLRFSVMNRGGELVIKATDLNNGSVITPVAVDGQRYSGLDLTKDGKRIIVDCVKFVGQAP
jgi:hypothetical protein